MKPCCKAGVKTYCHLPALTSVHRSAPHQRPLSARYSCNSPPATFGACHASLQDKTIKECSVLYSTLLQCITFQINSGDIGLNHVISFENFLTNDQTATVQCRYATTSTSTSLHGSWAAASVTRTKYTFECEVRHTALTFPITAAPTGLY